MIDAAALRSTFADYLGDSIRAGEFEGQICLLTPAQYPDGDLVSVWVGQDSNRRLTVSDLGAGDAQLIGTLGAKAARNQAERIAKRFDVEFQSGSFLDSGELDGPGQVVEDTIAAACWRVAQASAALANCQSDEQIVQHCDVCGRQCIWRNRDGTVRHPNCVPT